jgi:hypothetical protein
MSAMELDGDVAAHSPSSPVSMAPPISTPTEQPSPREEKRCELSDDAGLSRGEQASRARPIKKEKNEEVVNKDKQAQEEGEGEEEAGKGREEEDEEDPQAEEEGTAHEAEAREGEGDCPRSDPSSHARDCS